MGQILEQYLENCWCVVSYTTNGAVDAILNGIPVICLSDQNITYNIADRCLSNIDNPIIPSDDNDVITSDNRLLLSRKQWCYNLAYAQWSVKEIKEGLPWKHFKKNLWR